MRSELRMMYFFIFLYYLINNNDKHYIMLFMRNLERTHKDTIMILFGIYKFAYNQRLGPKLHYGYIKYGPMVPNFQFRLHRFHLSDNSSFSDNGDCYIVIEYI